MTALLSDFRSALRLFARRPTFVIPLVVVLALGIGGTTAMFSVMNAVILRPLPYHQPDRIAVLPGASYPDIETWAKAPSLVHLAVYSSGGINLTGQAQAERVQAAAVSWGFFPVFQAVPQLGRTFGKQDEIPGNHHVAIISDGMWGRAFGFGPHAVGSTIHLNGIPHTIIGVMRPDFKFPGQTELWVPAAERFHSGLLGKADQPELPDSLDGRMVGRLRDGATFQQATIELETLRRRLEEKYAGTSVGVTSIVRAVPLERMLSREVRPALTLLFVGVNLVLFIACANAAGLLLAQGVNRRKEVAVRLCLGASPSRVARQLLTEAILIALVSGALGVLLADWSIDLIRAISPAKVPRISEVRVDLAALGFAFAVSLIVGVLAGLAPALAAGRQDLTSSLNQGGVRGSGGMRQRARSILVVSEVALAVVLLTGTTLVIQSFFRLTRVSPGIDTENLITMTLSIPPTRLGSLEKAQIFYDRVLAELAGVPGVIATGGASSLPLGAPAGYQWLEATGDGRTQQNLAFGDYFRTMAIPLMRGRTFGPGDGPGAPPVVIVNETLARRISPDGNALGLHLRVGGESFLREVVGIVGGTKQGGLEEPAEGQLYQPFFQVGRGGAPPRDPVIVIRTAAEPGKMVPAIRARLLALDKDLVVFRLKTMEEVASQTTAPLRFRAQLLGTFCLMGLGLTALGVYGLVSYSVAARTHEIGVRMVLGAARATVVQMVLWQGARLAILGTVIGVGAAWGLSRLLTNLLFGISPNDPASLVSSAMALVVIAMAACLIPALRACRVEPAAALRCE